MIVIKYHIKIYKKLILREIMARIEYIRKIKGGRIFQKIQKQNIMWSKEIIFTELHPVHQGQIVLLVQEDREEGREEKLVLETGVLAI